MEACDDAKLASTHYGWRWKFKNFLCSKQVDIRDVDSADKAIIPSYRLPPHLHLARS